MRFRPRRLVALGVTSFVCFVLLTLLQNQLIFYSSDLDLTIINGEDGSMGRVQQQVRLSQEVREFLGQVRKVTNVTNPPEVDIWPKPNEHDDRIMNQLRYKPPAAQGMKVIYFPQGPPSELVIGKEANKNKLANDQCLVQNCVFTGNYAEARGADAVIWMNGMTRMPFTKRPNQIWIMFHLESVLHSHSLKDYNGLINWTATYRRDSVLVTPYERFVHYDNFTELPVQPQRNYALGKTKKVAWFVSNCNAINGRLEYAHELQKHIDVDIYGLCGTMMCKRGPDDRCFKMLNKEYKFYLSFENSNCVDYITEKFYWNGLLNDVIPVVMGARPEDYAAVAPPQSYIHVDDFASPKELADYLHKLDSDDDLYNSYFRWKNTGYFMNTKFWCRLCAMLHGAAFSEPFYYRDIEGWWRNDSCVLPTQTGLWSSWTNQLKA